MSLESNKRIDDLLKRFVKKRHEETRSDFELHPATRKMLQGEVARVFPKGETETKRPLFSALWPRLALAGAFTAMLLMTVIMLNRPQKTESGFQLSQNAKAPVAETPPQAQPAMHDAVTLSEAVADKKDVAKLETPASSASAVAKRSIAEKETASVSGIEATGGIPAEGKSYKATTGQIRGIESNDDARFLRSETVTNSARYYSYGVTNEVDRLQTRGAAVAAVSVPAPGAPPANLYDDAATQNRWKFVQQDLRAKYRQNLLSPAQPAVLQSFEVARAGNKIQLFDSDGSVYEGEILNVAVDKLGVEEAKQNKELPVDFFFRVTGTNQQINRIVTFTGNFAVTNANQSFAKTPMRAADNFQSGEFARRSGVVVGNGLIQGKVSVGGTNEFEIQAAEVTK